MIHLFRLQSALSHCQLQNFSLTGQSQVFCEPWVCPICDYTIDVSSGLEKLQHRQVCDSETTSSTVKGMHIFYITEVFLCVQQESGINIKIFKILFMEIGTYFLVFSCLTDI